MGLELVAVFISEVIVACRTAMQSNAEEIQISNSTDTNLKATVCIISLDLQIFSKSLSSPP